MISFPHLAPGFSLGLVLAGDPPKGLAQRVLTALHAEGKPCFAADGGNDHLLALGIRPKLILGDGDSLTQDDPTIQRVCYPREKDFTDGAAAMAYALEHSTQSIAVCGVAGGRTDMFLSNFLLPLSLKGDIQRLQLFTDHTEAAYCQSRCLIQGQKGDVVSLIPLTPRVEGISLTGLEYPLERERANFADSRFISNVLQQEEASVEVEQGTLLVLHRIANPPKGRITMDKITSFLNEHENELWEKCFPYCYRAGQTEGTYAIRNMENLLLGVELGEGLTRLRRRAELRVDLALAALWPEIQASFPINCFPHRLAACTDVLRELDFGNKGPDETRELAKELASALDDLEATLEGLAAKVPKGKGPAEATPKELEPILSPDFPFYPIVEEQPLPLVSEPDQKIKPNENEHEK